MICNPHAMNISIYNVHNNYFAVANPMEWAIIIDSSFAL